MAIAILGKRTYQSGEPGDRLRPSFGHGRYWHLVMLRDRIQETIELKEFVGGEVFIDFGCGSAPYRPLFVNEFSKYVGVDLEGNADSDLTLSHEVRIPVVDGYADCVLSIQVVEHVESPQNYLREAARVLARDGSLVLSTHGFWKYHPDMNDYWRWTKDGLVKKLERAGFEVVHMAGVFGLLGSSLQLLYDGLTKSLPSFFHKIVIVSIQAVIGLVERGKERLLRNDASVYVVLARKVVKAT